MPTNIINDRHKSRLTFRFEQIILLTSAILFIALISTSLLNFSVNTLSIFSIDILTMGFLVLLIKKDKVELAKFIYLWTNVVVVSYLFWESGGILSSSLILVYPIMLMVSALLGGSKTFFSIFAFIITQIVFLGVTAINSGNAISTSALDYWQLILVVLLVSASAYTAWRFNDDMKYALRQLNSEASNVKKSRSEIERLIHYDPLTGLSSRFDSEERYRLLRSGLDKKREQISFLFLDLDNFKSINDYYNHATGDELLKQVADRLLGLIQEEDVACRLSGDEFLLIITRANNYNIKQLAQRILYRVAKPVEVFGNMIEITVSVGVALYDEKLDQSFEGIVKRADLAMYRAKQSGKNKCSFYDEALFLQTSRKNRITNGLTAALKNDDFELFVQPKVDILTGKIQSAETLIRWVRNNPENISPAEFIPLIESTELICNIGEWVISKACRLSKELHNRGHLDIPVSVNISSAQFVRGGLEHIILEQLQDSFLPPRLLELELTEHILFQDDDDVMDELSRIQDLGVTLSIDDFGTGYSNLGYLTQLKVDSLKIDQSFVKSIDGSPENFAIVDAIIKMSKALGIKIIAEGVETEEEWEVLKNLGCDYGQGFLWSKPLSSEEFLDYVAESV